MATNAQIITGLAQSVKDGAYIEKSQADYILLLNDAQDFIVEVTECLIKISSTDVVLAGSTQEYNLPSDFIKFPELSDSYKGGYVSIGTNGKYRMLPITIQELDLNYAGWRTTTAGTPAYFYIIEGATPSVGFHPKPSASWVTTNGSAVYFPYVYRPTLIADNSNLPFDNSTRLRGLQYLLKLRAKWFLQIDNGQFNDADRVISLLANEIMEAKARIKIMNLSGFSGFHLDFKNA